MFGLWNELIGFLCFCAIFILLMVALSLTPSGDTANFLVIMSTM